MKAYVIKNNINIKPFLDEDGDLLIGNKRLGDWQNDVFSSLNLTHEYIRNISEINDNDEYVALWENVYLTKKLLKEFIEISRKKKTNTICAVKKGVFTTRSVINVQEVVDMQDYVHYNLLYFPKKEFRGDTEPVIFDLDKKLQHILFPDHMCEGEKYFVPFNEKLVIQMNHWANLWSANLIYILSYLYNLEKNKLMLVYGAIKSLSFNKWGVLSKLNKVGRGCDIHPSSYIEGSIIGKGVTIGAEAIIRESIIGDGAFIGNGVIIESSVVGNKSTILNGHVLQSVLYPESFSVTHFISASIIGKKTFVGSGAVLTDFRFDKKPITLMKESAKVDSGNIFLGCCLGHNVYLGGGCVVAPGREIPNGTKISLDESKIITGSLNKKDGGFRIT